MHIKTLSDSDFLRWTDVLKSLVTNGGVKEQERRQRRRKAAKKNKSSDSAIAPAIGLGLNVGINALRPLDMTTVYHCVSRMQAVSYHFEPGSVSMQSGFPLGTFFSVILFSFRYDH